MGPVSRPPRPLQLSTDVPRQQARTPGLCLTNKIRTCRTPNKVARLFKEKPLLHLPETKPREVKKLKLSLQLL